MIDGPYSAPTLGVTLEAKAVDCNFCKIAKLVAGVQLGWDAPWGAVFDPSWFGVGEAELYKDCDPLGDSCEDDTGGGDTDTDGDGGGGGGDGSSGGSWGDVHLISHDGLQVDFQAGGEFVLVRSTDAAAPLQVQTRQEPMKPSNITQADLSLSYNTAVATEVDGQRVGLYARYEQPLYVGGQAVTLNPGESMELGQGSVARDASGSVYTFTYPSGDVMTVRHNFAGATFAHVDIKMALAASRAGKVEGLLGNADGDPSNDIALPGGALVPQPVSFEGLYRGPQSFTEKWRVAGGTSLFVTVESKTYGVNPLHGSTVDCAGYYTFRAPGAAEANTWGTEIGFKIHLEWFGQYAEINEPPVWHTVREFDTSNPPYAGWHGFDCHDIGLGWGECSWESAKSDDTLCPYVHATKFRWSLTRVGEDAPAFTYEFAATDSNPGEDPVI